MNNIKTIIKYELSRYFNSPLAFVYLICYLLLSGSCAVYFGNFFVNEQANLWAFFDFQPWIFLLFITGISMRSWAEEFRSKSIVLLLTSPVGLSDIIWGKFIATWLFCGIALLLTFPFPVIVNLYGNPDNVVIFIGYLGCFLLAGAMLSISQTMSALTKNPVIALVLAVFVNLLFFWSSFDYVLFLAREFFNDTIVDTIVSFSFLAHFSSLSRGMIELRDLIFFVSLILFFNLTTFIIISLKTRGNSKILSLSNFRQGFLVFVLLLIVFFSINVIANNVFRQFNHDFTAEKYLSLTKNTKDVLKNLKRPVLAKLYYSPALGQRNPEIQQLYNQIKFLLKQYKSYSKGNFDYKIYNPKFLDKVEDMALAEGIQPIPLIDVNQNALFGISFSDSLLNKSVIPFFALERLAFLEQDLTTNIYKLHHEKKIIGLLSSLPLMGGIYDGNIMIDKWEVTKQIETTYDIKVISKPEDLNEEIDALMIVHPYNLSDDFVEQIKKQRNVLLLMDIATEASRLYAPSLQKFKTSNIAELAQFWGIYFYDIGVVADFDNSITVDETKNYKKNPSFIQDLLQFKLTSKDMNSNHRISYKLDNILFSSASMVLPRTDADVLYFPLLKASLNSNILDATYAQNGATPHDILSAFSPSKDPIIIAAEFLSNNPSVPFTVIAVGDTDFIYDSFWAKKTNFLDNSYSIALFDNANFILNSLDYLTKNNDLIDLRGKKIRNRPLGVISKMRKDNLYRYRLKETDIFQAINGAKQRLKELSVKKDFEERDTFTADELAIIGKTRQEIDSLRQSLSDLRINAYENIEKLEVKIKFFCIYFIPLLLLISIFCYYLWQKRKVFSLCCFSNLLTKKMVKLGVLTLSVFILALISIYWENRTAIFKYENKPVFPNFAEKVNSVHSILLQNGENKLSFEKKNGVWILKENPDFPVYQERVRRLFIAVNDMFFYEKKSDRVEDLKYFGFLPHQDKNTPMVSVDFTDDKGKNIENFDIGWHNLDIGRGSKAAFIKFRNLFQVWFVGADFYDLSLDIKEWTYSSLWNLRFGRFIQINDKKDDDYVMNIAKKLLNIHYLDIVSDVNPEKIAKIKLDIENNNAIYLVFYQDKENNKFYVSYDFIKEANGKHLVFYAHFVKDKFLEISEEDWKKIEDGTVRIK